LVVDDNISLTDILQQMLVDKGFEVNAATDGQEGYLAYRLNRPDVILADIHLPGENGMELLKRIRMHDPEARVIYMSSDWESFQSVIQEEQKKFCTSFLRKPFSGTELMRLLSECLNPRGKGAPQRV